MLLVSLPDEPQALFWQRVYSLSDSGKVKMVEKTFQWMVLKGTIRLSCRPFFGGDFPPPHIHQLPPNFFQ